MVTDKMPAMITDITVIRIESSIKLKAVLDFLRTGNIIS
jgi:hypothetical protein